MSSPILGSFCLTNISTTAGLLLFYQGGAGKPAGQKPTSTGKMRYVPPPTRAQASSAAPPAGKGKMKYVPPPKDAGVWARPQVNTMVLNRGNGRRLQADIGLR